MSQSRIEQIEETLVYHHRIKKDGVLQCLCGYVYPLGGSIWLHTAEIVDQVLQYEEELYGK